MKKYKRIIINNPNLRNLRNNLRNIIQIAESERLTEFINQKRKINEIIRKIGKISEEDQNNKQKLESKIQQLERKFNESICICRICQKSDKDMVYATRPKEWFCIDCYETKLPKNMQEKWEPNYPLSKGQIIEFLDKLNEVVDQCKTNLNLSKEILTRMGISKNDQKSFLETLSQYGGHCDCEIIMNAYPYIMADFNIDFE